MSYKINGPVYGWMMTLAMFLLLVGCDPQHTVAIDESGNETTINAFNAAYRAEMDALHAAEEQAEAQQAGKSGASFFSPMARASWNQFGKDMGNTNHTRAMGPWSSISSATTLSVDASIGGTIGSEVGVITNDDDEYVVSSYDPHILIFDATGTHLGTYNFSVSYGPRAVPYYDNTTDMIYTGAEGGGFYEIAVDRTTSPYTLSLNSSDATVGTIESSPVMAYDGTVYVAGQWGTVYRYSTDPLTLLASYSLGEVVTGAPALYNADPSSAGQELLVATTSGNLYVLSHDLSSVLGSNTDGAGGSVADIYYSGVTVARRSGDANGAVALLGITSQVGGPYSSNTGMVRAIQLTAPYNTEWEMTPSGTTLGGTDQVEGSIAVLHPRFGNHIAIATSTDGNVYGIDISSSGAGTELWSYTMTDGVNTYPGKAAAAVGRYNGVYVVDGGGYVHVLFGPSGAHQYTYSGLYIGSTQDIGKVAITAGQKLGVGSGSTAYILDP